MPESAPIKLVKYSAPLDVQALPIRDLRQRAIAGRWQNAPHRVDFCHLFLVTDGDFNHMVDFVPIRSAAGSLLLVKPGQVHAFDFDSPWDGWLVVFKPEAIPMNHDFRPNQNDVLDSLPTLIELTSDEREAALGIVSQMQGDAKNYKDQSDGNLLMRTALMYLLLRLQVFSSSANQQSTVGKATSHRFQQFKELVEEWRSQHHHIHQYASKLGCSEKSLNRSVLAVTGVSAKAYLTQRIVLEAKRLLVHTTQPVGMIGIDLGFDEPTNFVKFFKREAGMLPMAFRQLYTKPSS